MNRLEEKECKIIAGQNKQTKNTFHKDIKKETVFCTVKKKQE